MCSEENDFLHYRTKCFVSGSFGQCRFQVWSSHVRGRKTKILYRDRKRLFDSKSTLSRKKDDIPIFKVEKSSLFCLSLLSLEGTKDFSKKEISALQNMNDDLHYSDLPAQPSIQKEHPSKVNEREFKKVLCLREFLENYESKAKNKQFVEVELFD